MVIFPDNNGILESILDENSQSKEGNNSLLADSLSEDEIPVLYRRQADVLAHSSSDEQPKEDSGIVTSKENENNEVR